jgi:hypothetical protein
VFLSCSFKVYWVLVQTASRAGAVISPDSALNGICNELKVENVLESWTVEGFDSLPGGKC